MTRLEAAAGQLLERKEASTEQSGGDSQPRTAALSQEVTYQVTGDGAVGVKHRATPLHAVFMPSVA